MTSLTMKGIPWWLTDHHFAVIQLVWQYGATRSLSLSGKVVKLQLNYCNALVIK